MKKRIFVAYASVSGSTGEVAEAIGAERGRQELEVAERHGYSSFVPTGKSLSIGCMIFRQQVFTQ